MLEAGFQPQVDALREALLHPAAASTAAANGGLAGSAAGGAARPQVALFTATMPASLAAVAAKWLQRPVAARAAPAAPARVDGAAAAEDGGDAAAAGGAAGPGGGLSISASVTQVVHVCAEHKKPAKLQKHLAAIKAAAAAARQRNLPRILIFANR